MTKCYGHEECEYNGQPECRLPDGMECPHGVKADKPAVKSWLDINEKLRAELDSVKCERDAAIKDLFEIIGDIEEIRCGYGVDNADTDEAFAELCNGYCANAGNLCYEEGEHYRCKHFKWRGQQMEG